MMQIFSLTLTQMMMMFSFILIGFLLRKSSIMADNAHVIMSRLETFVFVPALNIGNMLKNCNVETFTKNAPLILYGTVSIIAALIIAQPLSGLFIRNSKGDSALSYQRNIYRYAMTFGNYGFVGNFIVLGVWGSEMFFKYTMFTMLPAIVCSAWGLYVLIPKEHNAGILQNLKKGLITPPLIALAAGVVMGLLNLGDKMPEFFLNMLSNAGNCMGPVAMLLAGFVVGGFNLKEMILNKKIYIATFFRLILIPAVFVLLLRLIGTSEEVQLFAFILFGTPLGLNTVVYPASYGGDTKTGASMAMISHTLCVITIPLMYLLLFEIM